MAWKRRKKPTVMWCEKCGGRFETCRPDVAKCCSPACRNVKWRANSKPLTRFEEKQITSIQRMNPALAATMDHVQKKYGEGAFRQLLLIPDLAEYGRQP